MRSHGTLLLSAFILALASPAQAGIRYVNAELYTGQNNGTSWADAFRGSNGLQVALGVALAGDQIWVAQGTYKPTPSYYRAVSFVLRNGIELYGGFAGTESSLSQRDLAAHATILTGDLSGNDDTLHAYGDNSLHVVDGAGTDGSAVLDGFTVRSGNANIGSANQDSGGGILCIGGAGPTLRHCVFRVNRSSFRGGAAYVENSSPTIVDCRFQSNLGGSSGGAFCVRNNTAPTFLRCVFTGNFAVNGGALYLGASSDAKLTNCVLWNNTATGVGGGGALYVENSNPVIRQCIVVGNRSQGSGTGGITAAPPIALANDILYFNLGPSGQQGLSDNVTGGNCTFCCVQGIGPGAGNISADPGFANLAAGDLHLSHLSPCADAGDNSSVPAGTTIDLDGRPRLSDDVSVPDTGQGSAPIVDIGAYELRYFPYIPFCAGDGSLATACPCGNTGAPGRGCLNSEFFSPGALLGASGITSPDAIVLTASDMPATSSCVFLQGDQMVASGVVFGDGVRCVGGSLKRLYVKSSSDGSASAPEPGDPSISARSAALGDPIAPGSRRYYQVHYRDSNPAFCSAPQGDSWNVTGGMVLLW